MVPASSEEAMALGIKDVYDRFGIEISVTETGHARGVRSIGPGNRNLYGIADGALLFHLADSTAGIAYLSAGGNGVTAGGNVNFMRPAGPETERVICQAKVEKRGRKISFVAAQVLDEAGALLADFSFIFANVG